MGTRAVYTALFGDYETLNDQQDTAPGIDFLCFTDNPELRSERWRIVVVKPAFPLDPHRSQRRLKILGDRELRSYDQTLYIDNAVSLHGDVNQLFDLLLADADMGMLRHSFRTTLVDEFAAVWREGLDDHHRLMEQWDHYAANYPEVLEGPTLWGGMIARQTDASVDDLCTTWYEHVLRYSRRDQLSAPVAVALHPQVRFTAHTLENYSSTWHTWPVPLARNTAMRAASSTVRVPREIATVKADAERVLELQARVEAATAERDAMATSLAQMRASRSWRVTAPLRSLRRD